MENKEYEIMSEVDNLLNENAFHSPSKKEIQKAITLLKSKNLKDPFNAGWLAKAWLLLKKPNKTIEICDDLIAQHSNDGRVRWAYFWKGAAFAILKNEKEVEVSISKAIAIDADIRKDVLLRNEFKPYIKKEFFMKVLGLKSPDDIDPQLKPLLDFLFKREPFKAYLLGKKIFKKCPDKASVLDGMISALEEIVEDISEHGNANLEDFGGGKISPETFEKERRKYSLLRSRIAENSSALSDALAWRT